MENENNVLLSVYDDNGKLKSLEDIKKELDQVYPMLAATDEDDSFVSMLSNPEVLLEAEPLIDRCNMLTRRIYLSSDITEEIGTEILEKIQFWNTADEFDGLPVDKRIPIQIYIDTAGGFVTNSFQIANAIALSKTPVYTIVTGAALSGGFLIAISGHKRYAFPNSSFMFHEGAIEFGGDAHKAIQSIDNYHVVLKQIKAHVLKHTKISDAEYESHTKDDWYISSEEAVRWGVVDEISTTLLTEDFYDGEEG